jgi:predicted permease
VTPPFWRRIPGNWNYLLRIFARRSEDEVDAELRFHFDERIAELTAQGLSPDAAHARANEEFGDVDTVRVRLRTIDRRIAHRLRRAEWWESVAQDLRYALRGLRRSPGFTVAVVTTLGLGIGANAAMFSIVDRLMFRPPPMLRDPASAHRVYLGTTRRGKEHLDNGLAYARYVDLAKWTTSFSRFAQITEQALAVGGGADTREMQIGAVSASFFDFFDAPPATGRYFTVADDAVPNGTPVAVLAYSYWQVQFGGRRDAVGSTIRIGPLAYTIIGVAPAGFVGLWPDQPPVAYIPITSYAGARGFQIRGQWWDNYGLVWSSTIAQRKPGVSVATANADLSQAYVRSYGAQIAVDKRATPLELAKPRALVASILSERGPNESNLAKLAAWISGVALIVLLIACANVANLLLARALNRRREIAVRLALGVSRRRLLSQLLTESVLLALLGGIAGVVIAQAGGAVLRSAFLPKSVVASVAMDPRTLLFAAGVALAVGLLTGLAPGLQVRHVDLTSSLKSGAREGAHHRSPMRLGLLIMQGALSVILLVGAGLFVRSLSNVRALRLGYDVDPVMLVSLNMRGVTLDSGQRTLLLDRMLATARTQPDVENASRETSVPFWSLSILNLFVEGIDSVRALGAFTMNAVSPEYFATVGTRILRGRGLSAEDRGGTPGAMVVGASMAKRLWPNAEAIGQCVKVGSDSHPCTYVVGVAEDIRAYQLQGDPGYDYYLAIAQFGADDGGIVIRTRGNSAGLAEGIRRRLQREMPGASYVIVLPFREIMGEQTRSWQLGARMFVTFGLLSLVLAAVGLFSVIAYNVAQRTHEFGVRVALGAQARDVARLMIGQGLRVSGVGLAIGVVVALWAGRFIKPLLFEESPRDPAVFAVVAASLLVVALLASLVPALRATRVDPASALRAD